MTGRSLLNDILKYTDTKNTDKDGNVISYNITDYYTALGTGNKIVKTYTFGDIYNLAKGAQKEGANSISAIKIAIKNVIPALNALGYTALDSVLQTMEKLLTSVEELRTVMKVYRTVKPIVDNAANVGDIVWNFAMIGKILQTVVQAVAKLAVAVAFAAIEALWQSILKIPICSVYEIKDGSKAVAEYSDLQNELFDEALADVEDLLRNLNTDEIIRITNDYLIDRDGILKSNFSFNIDSCIAEIENLIKQVAYDKKANKLYIADDTDIYRINYNKEEQEHSVEKVDAVDNTQNFFVYDDHIYKPEINYTGLFFSPTDTYGFLSNIIYNAKTETEITRIDQKYTILSATYDENTNNDIYCIAKESNNNYSILKLCKQGDVFTTKVYYATNSEISDIKYFEGKIYFVKKDGSAYSINTINANHSFSKLSFNCNKAVKYVGNIVGDYLYITTGNNISRINYSKLCNNGIVETETVCSSLTANIMAVNRYTYNNEGYYVCPCGYGMLISKANQELWTLRDVGNNYNSIYEIDNDKSNIYSDCFEYGGNYYFYTPNRICRITTAEEKADLFTGNDSIVSTALSPNIRAPQNDSEKWNNSEPITIMDNLNYHDSVAISKISSDALIEKVKVIGNKIYVSVTDFLNANNTGIYELENFTTFTKLNLTIPTENGKPIRIYSFDKINDQWYIANSTEAYCYYGNTPVVLSLDCGEDAISDISHYSKTESGVTSEYIIVYLLNSILFEKAENSVQELQTCVKINSSEEIKLGRTENSLIIYNDKNTYNVIYDTNVDNIPFQTLSTNNEYNLKQVDYGVVFINENEIYGNAVGTSVKDNKYHTGYAIDTSFGKWKGCAPYFLSTNTLRNNLNTIPRNDFIFKFKNSFKIDSEKLFTNAPTAVIEYLRKELKKSISQKLSSRITDNVDNALITKLKQEGTTEENIVDSISQMIIKSVTDLCVNYVNVYLNKAFAAKLKSGDVFNNFAEETYKLCIADLDNDLTTDFYKNIAILLQDTTETAMDDSNEIDIADSLVGYYQKHKYEWADSGYPENMYAKVVDDRVDYSKYKSNVEGKTFLLDDAKFHNDFYNNLNSLYAGKDESSIITDAERAELIINLENSAYKITPTTEWQDCISSAVSDYKSAQGDQYRDIITSNSYGMYPLQTNDLPSKINLVQFSGALTLLLDYVREEIKKKIYILVDQGNVKCYSCIDNSSVISNIINENTSVYKNQCKTLLKFINSKEVLTWGELKDKINATPFITKDTCDLLKNILDKQSSLYASYLTQIIYKEAIEIGKDVYETSEGHYIVQEGTTID